MAITKLKQFYGKDFDAYAKIVNFNVIENGVEDNEKRYEVSFQLNIYDSSEKTYQLAGEKITIYNVKESDLTLSNLYSQLKLKDSYSDWTDC